VLIFYVKRRNIIIVYATVEDTSMQLTKQQSFGFSTDRLDNVTRQLQGYIVQRKLAGAVTLLARCGDIVQLEALGQAVIDPPQPMRTDTIFRIYSMTKPITAAAVLILFEEGFFRLTDPVSRFLPAFKQVRVLDLCEQGAGRTVPPNREITIHDLLTHTAGLSYGFDENNIIDERYRERIWQVMEDRHGDVSLQELVEAMTSIPLAFHPGTAYRYSMANDVLGHLIEVVTGLSFAEILTERIFEPLGMVDTGFYVPAEKVERFAAVYTPAEDGGLKLLAPADEPRYLVPPRAPSGGGGLVSTAMDYWRFAQMLLNGGELDGTRILGRKTVELMTTNALPHGVMRDGQAFAGYGLGVEVVAELGSYRSLGSVGKFGWSGAATTHFFADPVENLVGILLVQLQPFDAQPVRVDFQNMVYQALL
jgi:CubicO group peptidase (beta-lactamase class C family)